MTERHEAGRTRSLSVIARRKGQVTPPSSALIASQWALALKRSLDIVGCLLLAVPLAIAVPVIALFVKLDSVGPVFFRQMRVARGGTTFIMYKFRSMHIDAEERLASDPELESLYHANGFKLPEADDPRVTRVGRLLRKWSLDELPQFINVLIGQMSLVGPRPILTREIEALYADDAETCLLVRPGLTGLWQVSGRSSIVGTERVELDRRYVEEWSVATDLGILVRTVPAVLSAKGAH